MSSLVVDHLLPETDIRSDHRSRRANVVVGLSQCHVLVLHQIDHHQRRRARHSGHAVHQRLATAILQRKAEWAVTAEIYTGTAGKGIPWRPWSCRQPGRSSPEYGRTDGPLSELSCIQRLKQRPYTVESFEGPEAQLFTRAVQLYHLRFLALSCIYTVVPITINAVFRNLDLLPHERNLQYFRADYGTEC